MQRRCGEFPAEPLRVEGSPRLGIEIGDHVGFATIIPDRWDGYSLLLDEALPHRWFEYEVRPHEEDLDGISITADAFDFSEGALLTADGVAVEIEFYAVAPYWGAPDPVDPGEPLATHRVQQPERRDCTDERQRALNHSRFVEEWDGTPFRVDIINSFPDHVTDAEVATLLEPVALLDEKIKGQLGYRILEAGDVLPVPAGMRPGWNLVTPEFIHTCQLPRDRGQILGYYTDASNDPPGPGADGQANPGCGTFTYLKRFSTIWPCPGCEEDALTLHEMFHVLGYVHSDNDEERLAAGSGVRMSWPLTRTTWPGAATVLWTDIDLLRCIFPERG